MKRTKWIAGIVLVIAGAVIAVLLLRGIQQLMISGTSLIDGMGSLLMENAEIAPQTTVNPNSIFTASDFDEAPAATFEPEELVEIPIEQTPEELAQEQADNS